MQKLSHVVGAALLALAPGGVAFSQTTCPPPVGTTPLVEDFNGALDPDLWLVARRQWGGTGANGGVRPETMHISDGSMKILAQGNNYTGPILGINKAGQQVTTGQRVGGALVTNKYYGSGSYEVRMKLAPDFGVVSTIWTFHYTEDGSVIGNHEIDIETPGRPAAAQQNISHNYALCNTWTGEKSSQFTTGYQNVGYNLADGQFHTLRFDWHTQDPNPGALPAKRVDFYFDGTLVRTNTTNIPTRAGRFWIGAWFPSGWAGTPNFDISTMEVDWVHITPFNEAGDQTVCETYPDDGFGNLNKIEVVTPTPPPTTPPPTTPPPTTPPPTTPPPTTPPPTTPPPTTPPPTTPPPTTPPPTTPPPTTPPPTTPPPTTPPPTTPPPTTPPPTPSISPSPTTGNANGFVIN